jgi:two-component system response regulator FlrC
MNDKSEILVIASDPETRKALSSILQTEGLRSVQASHLSEGRALLASQTVGMVFCERHLADGTYLDLLPVAQTKAGNVPVVVTSRLADWDEYLEALRNGAVDLIASPCKPSDVTAALAQARREKSVEAASDSDMKLRAVTA